MVRLIVGILLGAVMVVFAIQNPETVSYTFIAWSLTAPRWLVIVAVFIIGLFVGWLVTGIRRLGRRR